MKKGLTVLLTCAVLAGSTLAQAQEQAYGNTIVSNKPHKQTTVQKPASAASSEVKPVAAAPQAQTAKPAKVQKEKPAKAAKKTAAPKQQKKQDKQKTTVQQSNWRLKVAQQKLNVLGFSDERPSGKMTQATTDALKSFQQKHSLKAHGELDDVTYRKLTWEAFTQKEGIQKVQGKDIVSRAARYKGVPYVFGGTTPKGFDCSGYVQYVFKDCKATLPRLADEQALKGVFVTQRQLRPGDLVFFTTYLPGASHVGIYAGSGQFWSASSSKGVILSSLKDDYWKTRYYGARRVLVTNGEI